MIQRKELRTTDYGDLFDPTAISSRRRILSYSGWSKKNPKNYWEVTLLWRKYLWIHQALRVAAENHSMRLLAGWNGVPLVGIGHSRIEGADPCLKAPKYPEFRCQVAGGYAQQDMFGIWVSDQDSKRRRIRVWKSSYNPTWVVAFAPWGILDILDILDIFCNFPKCYNK